MEFRHRICDRKLEPNQVIITLPSGRLKEMKDGVRIDLIGYSVWGDEFATYSSCQEIRINGSKPTVNDELIPARPY